MISVKMNSVRAGQAFVRGGTSRTSVLHDDQRLAGAHQTQLAAGGFFERAGSDSSRCVSSASRSFSAWSGRERLRQHLVLALGAQRRQVPVVADERVDHQDERADEQAVREKYAVAAYAPRCGACSRRRARGLGSDCG